MRRASEVLSSLPSGLSDRGTAAYLKKVFGPTPNAHGEGMREHTASREGVLNSLWRTNHVGSHTLVQYAKVLRGHPDALRRAFAHFVQTRPHIPRCDFSVYSDLLYRVMMCDAQDGNVSGVLATFRRLEHTGLPATIKHAEAVMWCLARRRDARRCRAVFFELPHTSRRAAYCVLLSLSARPGDASGPELFNEMLQFYTSVRSSCDASHEALLLRNCGGKKKSDLLYREMREEEYPVRLALLHAYGRWATYRAFCGLLAATFRSGFGREHQAEVLCELLRASALELGRAFPSSAGWLGNVVLKGRLAAVVASCEGALGVLLLASAATDAVVFWMLRLYRAGRQYHRGRDFLRYVLTDAEVSLSFRIAEEYSSMVEEVRGKRLCTRL